MILCIPIFCCYRFQSYWNLISRNIFTSTRYNDGFQFSYFTGKWIISSLLGSANWKVGFIVLTRVGGNAFFSFKRIYSLQFWSDLKFKKKLKCIKILRAPRLGILSFSFVYLIHFYSMYEKIEIFHKTVFHSSTSVCITCKPSYINAEGLPE